MRQIKTLAVVAVQMWLVYAGEFAGHEWAGNVGIFMAWFFIVVSMLGWMVDQEKLFEGSRPSWWRPYADAALVAMFAAAGWTATALFWMVAAIGLYIKYEAHRASAKVQP